LKRVDLRTEKIEMTQLLGLARESTVLVIASDGREFLVAEADDFEAEVEAFRNSRRFQSFLDERVDDPSRIPIEEIEKEIEERLQST